MTSSRVRFSTLSFGRRFTPLGLSAIAVWLVCGLPLSADDAPPSGAPSGRPSSNPLVSEEDAWVLGGSNSGSLSGGNRTKTKTKASAQPADVGGFGVNARMGHVAGEGVGRRESMTYIELAPFITVDSLFLATDFRILRTNTGDLAGSVGGIARRYVPSRNAIWGANLYYDIDETYGSQFQQIGFGFEFLSDKLDNRTNFYIPVGDDSKPTASGILAGSERFQGNSLYFSQFTEQTTASTGMDTMFAMPVPGRFAERINLEASAGAYYFRPNDSRLKDFIGPKFRLDGTLARRLLHMYVEATHDRVNDGLVSFGVDVNYWNRYHDSPRSGGNQYHRVTEWVQRNWTMVAVNETAVDGDILAINPATGLPYFIEHVDSNATGLPSDGTFERPWTTIQSAQLTAPAAPGEIIFVHAGSVFNTPIAMNAGETIIGEGVLAPISLVNGGTVYLPESGKGGPRPILTGITGPAVTLADNTTFGGFTIGNITNGPAILGDGITNARIFGTDIANIENGRGVVLQDSHGLITLDNVNMLRGNTADPLSGIDFDSFVVSGGDANIQYTNSTIENTQARAVRITDGAGGNINLSSLLVNNYTGGEGVIVENSAANVTFGRLNIQGGTVDLLNVTGNTTFVQPVFIDASTANAENPGHPLRINGSTGFVQFAPSAPVVITNQPGAAIDLRNISGTVRFSGNITVTDPAVISPALVWQQNSGQFISDGTFTAGAANSTTAQHTQGILIGDRLGLQSNLPGSTFRMNGQFNIVNSYGTQVVDPGPPELTEANAAIEILNDPSNVFFSGGTIAGRNPDATTPGPTGGIEIVNTSGAITFTGTTTISNVDVDGTQASSQFAALDVTNAVGDLTFDTLNILGAGGPATSDPAIRIFNSGDITFDKLNVEFLGAALGTSAIDIRDSGVVTAKGGVIAATGARAISLIGNEEIAWTSDAVSASGDTAGIVIEGQPGHFVVTGTTAIGSGGVIQNNSLPGSTGAIFDYSSESLTDTRNYVKLNGMVFNGNFNAITATNLYSLTLQNSDIINTTATGAVTFDNVLNAAVVGTRFSNNVGTMLDINASVKPTNNYFNYLIEDSQFIDGATATTGPMISIDNLAGAEGASLNLVVRDNGGPVSGYTGFTYNRTDPTLSRENGIFGVRWNGPILNASFQRNSFAMVDPLGASPAGQTGVVVTNADSTVDSTFIFMENTITAGTGTDTIGVLTDFAGRANVQIVGNETLNTPGVAFKGIRMLGNRAEAFRVTLRSGGNIVRLEDNEIVMSGDDSIGFNFPFIAGNTRLSADGNRINFNRQATTVGPGERGFVFGPIGGTMFFSSDRNNEVIYAQPDALSIAFPNPFIGSHVGTLLINGQRVPN